MCNASSQRYAFSVYKATITLKRERWPCNTYLYCMLKSSCMTDVGPIVQTRRNNNRKTVKSTLVAQSPSRSTLSMYTCALQNSHRVTGFKNGSITLRYLLSTVARDKGLRRPMIMRWSNLTLVDCYAKKVVAQESSGLDTGSGIGQKKATSLRQSIYTALKAHCVKCITRQKLHSWILLRPVLAGSVCDQEILKFLIQEGMNLYIISPKKLKSSG